MNMCISSHTNYIQFTNRRSAAVGLELIVFIRVRDNVQNIISLTMRKPRFYVWGGSHPNSLCWKQQQYTKNQTISHVHVCMQMFKNKNKIKIQNTNRKWLHCTTWPHSGAMQKPHCDFCRQKLTKFSLNSTILTGTNASTLIGYYAYYFDHSWHKTYFGRLSLGALWACSSDISQREYPEPTWYHHTHCCALVTRHLINTGNPFFLGGAVKVPVKDNNPPNNLLSL